MKRASLFIKEVLFGILIFMCVFQTVAHIRDSFFKDDSMDTFTQEVEQLKKDTSAIISENPSYCTLIRDVQVKDESGNVINYKKIEIPDVVVRIAPIERLQNKETLLGTIEKRKTFSLTALPKEDIKCGDILKDKTGFIYRVIEIKNYTLGGNDESHCYKKSGFAEWLIL